MNPKHKATILALSLSVLTLATVSTLLSLNQSGVLGVTTIGVGKSQFPLTTRTMPKVSLMPTREEVKPTPWNTSGAIPCETFAKVFALIGSDNSVYPQLRSLLNTHCPTTSVTPEQQECKTGISSYAVGQVCTLKTLVATKAAGSYAAKVTCYDGSSTTIGDVNSKVCYQNTTLQALAQKFCQGKSSCNSPTGVKVTGAPRPSVYITGTKTTTYPRPSLYPTQTELTCGWCGRSCTFIKAEMACPMIAQPSDQQCLLVGNECRAVTMNY